MHEAILSRALDALPRLDSESARQVEYIFDQLESGRREAADEALLADRLKQIIR